MKAIILSLALVAALAGGALAFECGTLQAQIDKEFGKRFDRTAATVRSIAGEAMTLHRAGRHEESVKKYDEAAKAGGMQLMHKKK